MFSISPFCNVPDSNHPRALQKPSIDSVHLYQVCCNRERLENMLDSRPNRVRIFAARGGFFTRFFRPKSVCYNLVIWKPTRSLCIVDWPSCLIEKDVSAFAALMVLHRSGCIHFHDINLNLGTWQENKNVKNTSHFYCGPHRNYGLYTCTVKAYKRKFTSYYFINSTNWWITKFKISSSWKVFSEYSLYFERRPGHKKKKAF